MQSIIEIEVIEHIELNAAHRSFTPDYLIVLSCLASRAHAGTNNVISFNSPALLAAIRLRWIQRAGFK